MEQQRKRGIVLGQVLQSYPPFTVRQLIAEGPGAFYPYVLSNPGITIPFRREEYRITSTYDSRTDLSWVIYALREWLSDRPRIIRYWEDHLDRLQQPEEMAQLEAALEAEWEEKWAQPDGSRRDDKPSPTITAEQVLANQRDELERIRQLTHEVTLGLQALEAEYPEAVAALDEVADEMARIEAKHRLRTIEAKRRLNEG